MNVLQDDEVRERRSTTRATLNTPGLVDIGTAKLYHQVHGSGPAVLLITGGTGDADDWGEAAVMLAREFTVVTYDRRGFSRSPRPDDWIETSMAEQADDAAALLHALGIAPAVVVGHSSGASITCCLVVRHPEVVRHAVLYEAPLLAAIPEGDEIRADFRTLVDQALAEGGPRRAMEAFMRRNAGDELYETFKTLDPAGLDRILDNGDVFFSLEFELIANFVPDRERLKASGVPLTVVTGEENRKTWYGTASRWLAEGSGADLVELPGGHVGFISHPTEFVDLVRRIAHLEGAVIN